MFNPTESERSLHRLEEQATDAQRDYEAACRELVRRADRKAPTMSHVDIAQAANVCESKRRAFDAVSERLRIARDM